MPAAAKSSGDRDINGAARDMQPANNLVRADLPTNLRSNLILTLYTTPVVYLYLDRVRRWRQRRKQVAYM